MNKIAYVFVLCVLIMHVSCRKDELEIAQLSNVNIINAILDGKTLRLNDYLRDSALSYNARNFSVKSGDKQLYMFPSGDSLNPYFKGKVKLDAGGIYSMFLSGIAKAPDTLWVKENVPAFYADSSIGVRFVNLSPDSGPLSFTLSSAPGINLFSGVIYREVTGFVKLPLPAMIPVGSTTFQVRDAGGNLLASYTLPARASSVYQGISIQLARRKSIILVVKGLRGIASGSNAIGVFPVKYY